MKLTHLDEAGNAIMVDVSDKKDTDRMAMATGTIYLHKDLFALLENNPKGDVLATARIAGILAAKNTSNVIPLCHPLPISSVKVDFELDEPNACIHAFSKVKCSYRTGVEMEALHAVSVALLTIYDMCKAFGKEMEIGNIHLLEKHGGKSGDFIWKES
jgi:cyclic pyranopterin phosphate synthase